MCAAENLPALRECRRKTSQPCVCAADKPQATNQSCGIITTLKPYNPASQTKKTAHFLNPYPMSYKTAEEVEFDENTA